MKTNWIIILFAFALLPGCDKKPIEPEENGNNYDQRNISKTAGTSWGSSIGVDDAGNIHVAWHDAMEGNWETYYTMKPSGGSWSTHVNISNTNETSIAAQMAVNGLGDVHVVWEEELNPTQIYYTVKAIGDTWSKPVNISNSVHFTDLPHVGLEDNRDVHVIWMGPGTEGIYYTTKTLGGSWSTPELIPNSGGGTNPALRVEPNGNVHVVMERGDYEIWHVSKPAGNTWSNSVKVSNSVGLSWIPEVAVDPQGYVYVTWDEAWEGFLYYAVKHPHPDSSFSTPIQISKTNGAPAHSPHAFDSQGIFHLMWEETGNGEIYYMKKPASGDWEDPINISNTSGISLSPIFVLDLMENLHILWSDKTEGNYEVYYDIVP
jgi:hypothetical protein